MRKGLDRIYHGDGLFPVQILRIHIEVLHRFPEIPGSFTVQIDDPVSVKQDIFFLFPQPRNDLFQFFFTEFTLLHEYIHQIVAIGDTDHRFSDTLQFLVLQAFRQIDIRQASETREIQFEEGQDMALIAQNTVLKAQCLQVILQHLTTDLIDPVFQICCGNFPVLL